MKNLIFILFLFFIDCGNSYSKQDLDKNIKKIFPYPDCEWYESEKSPDTDIVVICKNKGIYYLSNFITFDIYFMKKFK